MTTVQTLPVSVWRGENTHPGALNFYPIFIPLYEAKVSGVSVQPSRRPKKTAGQIEKETFWFCIGCYWIVGAVFNRDYPGNRGQRPLPPTINYSLNDIEFYAVSYECSCWPKNGQFNQKITTFL
jgi:hypothetical protein